MKNTGERTPPESYGPAAARFNAEQKLGARVVEILRKCPPPSIDAVAEGASYYDWCGTVAPLIEDAARSRGLLGEDKRP